MLFFTESLTGGKVAVNPVNIVAVYTVTADPANSATLQLAGKTAIGVTNGSIVVNEPFDDVVAVVSKVLSL